MVAEINLAESINRISDLNTKVPTTGFHVCEECLTSFDSEQALQGHLNIVSTEGRAPVGYNPKLVLGLERRFRGIQ